MKDKKSEAKAFSERAKALARTVRGRWPEGVEAEWAELAFVCESARFWGLLGLDGKEDEESDKTAVKAGEEALEAIAADARFDGKKLDAPLFESKRGGRISPLERAGFERGWNSAERLLAAGADPRFATEEGGSPLRCALIEFVETRNRLGPSDRSGDARVIQMLLRAGARPEPDWEEKCMAALVRNDARWEGKPLFDQKRVKAAWDAALREAEASAIEEACAPAVRSEAFRI